MEDRKSAKSEGETTDLQGTERRTSVTVGSQNDHDGHYSQTVAQAVALRALWPAGAMIATVEVIESRLSGVFLAALADVAFGSVA